MPTTDMPKAPEKIEALDSEQKDATAPIAPTAEENKTGEQLQVSMPDSVVDAEKKEEAKIEEEHVEGEGDEHKHEHKEGHEEHHHDEHKPVHEDDHGDEHQHEHKDVHVDEPSLADKVAKAAMEEHKEHDARKSDHADEHAEHDKKSDHADAHSDKSKGSHHSGEKEEKAEEKAEEAANAE